MKETCRYTRNLVTKWNAGELGREEKAHLQSCPHCQLAIQIRNEFLKDNGQVSDQSELIWRQYTIDRLIRRERAGSSMRFYLFLFAEIIFLLFAGYLLLKENIQLGSSNDWIGWKAFVGLWQYRVVQYALVIALTLISLFLYLSYRRQKL